MMVTITAKTPSENAAIRSAVILSSRIATRFVRVTLRGWHIALHESVLRMELWSVPSEGPATESVDCSSVAGEDEPCRP
jgi:hypothetical protein